MGVCKTGAFALIATVAAIGGPAVAQDAAETAIILSGTSAPQAKAGRSLGSAISGAMRRSTATLRVRGQGRGASRNGGQADNSRTLPEGVDALEGTDAPAYTLGSGATIRVSGRLNPSARTVCARNCEPAAETEDEPGATEPPEEAAAPESDQ